MNEFAFTMIGAFSGALLGFVGTEIAKFFLEPGKRLEARRDDILASMIAIVQRIEEIGPKYWRGSFPKDSPEIGAVEQEIRSGIHELIKEAGDLFDGYEGKKAECEGIIRSLRILSTGGEFGDGLELNEPKIALEISIKCGDLKRSLRNRRHELRRRLL